VPADSTTTDRLIYINADRPRDLPQGKLAMDAESMAQEHHRSVAIVDDDAAFRDALGLLLELAGHSVAIYASAAAFLDDPAARPACLILDQHMPKMTGLELAARLRALGTRIPVMLVTTAPSPAIVARAALLGIEKVLCKPPTEADLLSFVNTHR
jgi:two-component system response regulator FixJ